MHPGVDFVNSFDQNFETFDNFDKKMGWATFWAIFSLCFKLQYANSFCFKKTGLWRQDNFGRKENNLGKRFFARKKSFDLSRVQEETLLARPSVRVNTRLTEKPFKNSQTFLGGPFKHILQVYKSNSRPRLYEFTYSSGLLPNGGGSGLIFSGLGSGFFRLEKFTK
jgi:hypothetical protein